MSNDAPNAINPLSQYFRGSPIYIQLPSCGFYSKPGDIETTPTGELAVFPMTTSDELLLKSPDTLINGESVAKIIQSCCPSVKNAYDLPAPDIEALLIAIKKATYGDQMEFTASCPKCKTQNEFAVSIDWALSNIKTLDPEIIVNLNDGLKVKIKPLTYASSVKTAILTFNETKFLQMITENDLTDEEKADKAAQSYKKAVNLTIELMADCILGVYDKTDNLITDNPDHIKEWVNNLGRGNAKLIETKMKESSSRGIAKEIEIECTACKHQWSAPIEYDPSSFFE